MPPLCCPPAAATVCKQLGLLSGVASWDAADIEPGEPCFAFRCTKGWQDPCTPGDAALHECGRPGCITLTDCHQPYGRTREWAAMAVSCGAGTGEGLRGGGWAWLGGAVQAVTGWMALYRQ